MTTRSKAAQKAMERGKLSLNKLTLRDLTVPGAGPKGGRIRWTTDGCPPPPTLYCTKV